MSNFSRNNWSERLSFGATNKINTTEEELSSQQDKQYLSYRNDDVSKVAAEEAAGLSGVPVRQVQEDLVQAQMACRRILHSTPPSSGRMLERTTSPKSRGRGRGRGVCHPPP